MLSFLSLDRELPLVLVHKLLSPSGVVVLFFSIAFGYPLRLNYDII